MVVVNGGDLLSDCPSLWRMFDLRLRSSEEVAMPPVRNVSKTDGALLRGSRGAVHLCSEHTRAVQYRNFPPFYSQEPPQRSSGMVANRAGHQRKGYVTNYYSMSDERALPSAFVGHSVT